MLLRRRAPGIESRPAPTTQGFEHLDARWVAVLRWLLANEVDFVLVGAAAEAIRGHAGVNGPVAIVPAPYRRNYGRLEQALSAAGARQRFDGAPSGDPETLPVKLTAEKLSRGHRWTLRCDGHDLDIEALTSAPAAGSDGGPGYQELLYEASRFELAGDIAVEVASPEDIEHYAHLARTGRRPLMRITRGAAVKQPSA